MRLAALLALLLFAAGSAYAHGGKPHPAAQEAQPKKALNSHDEFRPGARTSLDVGYRLEATDKLGLMLQLNALHRARDRGEDAESPSSGGRFLFVSPGLSYVLLDRVQL